MKKSQPHPPRPSSSPPAVTLDDLAEARALRAEVDPACFDEANDPNAWLFEPAVRELIARLVDEEVAKWTGLLPPEGLRALREELVLSFHTDPVTLEYLNRIRPRPAQAGSGKVKKTRAGAPKPAVTAKKAGGDRS